MRASFGFASRLAVAVELDAAAFLMGFPIGFLAVAGAAACCVAFGAALQWLGKLGLRLGAFSTFEFAQWNCERSVSENREQFLLLLALLLPSSR